MASLFLLTINNNNYNNNRYNDVPPRTIVAHFQNIFLLRSFFISDFMSLYEDLRKRISASWFWRTSSHRSPFLIARSRAI